MAPFIQHLLLSSLEPLINHALQADPKRDALLKPLVGKTLAIQLQKPDIRFSVVFAKQSLHLLQDDVHDADASIHSSGHDLFLQVMRPQQIQPQSSLQLRGDALMIQAFWRLCSHFNPQWEQWLAPYLGHTAAYHLGQTGRRAFSWVQVIGERLKNSTHDYLQFDAKWWVSRAESTEFFDAVDQLRLDAERLEMRIARLRKQLTEAVTTQ
jgi:ubiquinone biosynthesis protein UbiJ